MKIHNLIKRNGLVFATVALIWCAIAGMKSESISETDSETDSGTINDSAQISKASYRQVFFHGFAQRVEPGKKTQSPLQRKVTLSESRNSIVLPGRKMELSTNHP